MTVLGDLEAARAKLKAMRARHRDEAKPVQKEINALVQRTLRVTNRDKHHKIKRPAHIPDDWVQIINDNGVFFRNQEMTVFADERGEPVPESVVYAKK